MKRLIYLTLLITIIISCQNESHLDHSENQYYYTCSMHPDIREDKPGQCPICGMGLTKVQLDAPSSHHKSSKTEQTQEELYYCEQDSSVRSRAPGQCPLDGSPMIRKNNEHQSHQIFQELQLRKSQVNHFKPSVYKVGFHKLSRDVRLLGSVINPQDQESNIPARIPGRVEKVYIESAGTLIKKGDPVLTFYSPRLITAAEEFLLSKRNYLKNKNNNEFKELYQQSKERLKLWGMTEEQINHWAKENKIPRAVTIYSPVTGIVQTKNAVKGRYFNEGQSFFDLVDLSSIWIEMDVYEHESAKVSLGLDVHFEFIAIPGKSFSSKIDFINPVLSSKTRTLKIRSTLKNPLGQLRPGMVATALMQVKDDSSTLAVPKTALIDTGKKKLVWRDLGGGKYQSVLVKTGFETDEYIAIVQGLNEGDKIVIDGSFLLDAQSKLFGVTQEHQH